MQNKEVGTVSDITKSLIGNWLAWYIILNIVYSLIYNYFIASIESMIVQAVIIVVLEALIVLCSWMMSTKFTFKNKSITRDSVRTVMRNLIIFTVIICAVNGIYTFVQANNAFNEAIESNYELKIQESMMAKIYSEEKMAEYNQAKNEAISDARSQLYVYFAIIEVCLVAVYLIMLLVEKKMISKNIQEGAATNAVTPPTATVTTPFVQQPMVPSATPPEQSIKTPTPPATPAQPVITPEQPTTPNPPVMPMPPATPNV